MQVQEIELRNIKPAESGERAKDVKSLAESIKAIGLIQPIVVSGSNEHYRIIAGHRRFAAMQLLKEKAIKCIVIEASDDRAQAMRISENVHRLPLTPLQEAEAIAKLRKLGRSTDEIAADLAMSAQRVARRERLTKLIPEWIKRWDNSKSKYDDPLTAAAAELIAVQEISTQKELLKIFDWENPTVDELKRRLAGLNQKLTSAPWPLDDALLVPQAGACSKCPKRSSCQALLFDGEVDSKKSGPMDLCLDSGCWSAKRKAFYQQRFEQAQEKHGNLLIIRGHDDWQTGKGVIEGLVDKKQIVDGRYQEAKKTDKGAKPAFVISGTNAGSIVYVSTSHKKSSGGSPVKKSLSAVDDRKARRGKIILQKINKVIYAKAVPKPIADANAETKLKMLASILNNCHGGDSKAWRKIALFSQEYQAHAVARIWNYVAGTIKLPDYSFAISLEYIDVVRPFAEKILGLNWADLEAEALKAVPDPKPKAGAA